MVRECIFYILSSFDQKDKPTLITAYSSLKA